MAEKHLRLTSADRLVLAQALYHPDVKGKKYEDRRARRRVAEALGIRKGVHWNVFPVPGDKERAFIALGAQEDKHFVRAMTLGDRRATVSDEAVDMLLGAIEKCGADADEETLLDVEEKLHALKDGKEVDTGEGLPGVNEPSVDDEFVEDDEEDEGDEE